MADWYRNLLAAGGGGLLWQGRTYRIGTPDPLNIPEALCAFPLPSRFLFWLDGTPQFVRAAPVA